MQLSAPGRTVDCTRILCCESGSTVKTNYYDKLPDSLILTARLKSDPTIPAETIELSLNTFEIIKSWGYKNSPSPYHGSIISLMKSSIPQIRSIAA